MELGWVCFQVNCGVVSDSEFEKKFTRAIMIGS